MVFCSESLFLRQWVQGYSLNCLLWGLVCLILHWGLWPFGVLCRVISMKPFDSSTYRHPVWPIAFVEENFLVSSLKFRCLYIGGFKLTEKLHCLRQHLHNSLNMEYLNWCLHRLYSLRFYGLLICLVQEGIEDYKNDTKRETNTNPATTPLVYSAVLPIRYHRAMMAEYSWE